MTDIAYYVTYDLPVPYKKLKIYPSIVKDYMLFSVYAQCLTIDKNSIPDPKIIKMSYLQYLYHLTQTKPDKEPYLLWLDRLLGLCLKDDDSFDNIGDSIKRYQFNEKGKPVIVIGKEYYDARDFEKIKSIIAEQNLVELPDTNISKEVRDSLAQAEDYKNKMSGNTNPPSLEDYLVSISSVTGWTLDYIYGMTIRKFIKTIRRLDNFVHYQIFLTASMSGFVEFKDKSFIKHWLTNLDTKNKFEDVSVDLTDMESKISFESAKAKEAQKYKKG